MSVADSCLSRIWTRCMSLSFGGICLGSKCLLLPSTGITNTPSGRLWCLVWRFCCVGKTQSGMFLSMSSGGSMLRSDSFSLLQASIVTIAEPSLPLLISSPQRLTAWWCRFMCTLFKVWFYSGSYPPNCWRGIFTLVPIPKTELATQKEAGETDTLEPHKTGRNRPRASCWSQGEQGLKTKLPTI